LRRGFVFSDVLFWLPPDVFAEGDGEGGEFIAWAAGIGGGQLPFTPAEVAMVVVPRSAAP
jgi:hypothetical protein